jgi:uncharacterized protein YceK
MNKMKKLAVLVFAVAGFSGCASTQVSSMARPDAPQARAAEPQVMRPMQSYGSLGGYRYRRFASASAAG